MGKTRKLSIRTRILSITLTLLFLAGVISGTISSYFFAKIHNQLFAVIISSAITTFITAIVLSWAFHKYVTLPLEKLVNLITTIRSKHQFSDNASQTTSDELGTLSASFAQMANDLQLLYGNLEAKVTQQTSQLEQHIQELGKAKAKDDALLESIGEGLVVIDTQSKIQLINAIAANYLDITTDKAHGMDARDIFHLCDMKGEQIPYEKQPGSVSLEKKQKIVQTCTVHRLADNVIALQITATPVIQNEKTVGIIMVLRDITREVEIDQMKTDFIFLASHQLRTPLSAIKWFIEMLLNGDAGPLNDEQKDFAVNISESTERMIQLVTSLLNISRLESGRMVIDPTPTDLQELLMIIVKELRPKIDEKQLTVVTSAYNGLPKIKLDHHLITQVYHNLLSNAVKYTQNKGEISILISKKDDEIISQITDTGLGIPKKQQEKVFTKFFRADNIARIEPDGTGLGLYLVKSIIETAGGRIWFESEEGKGTTFWFTLPISGMKPRAGDVTLDSQTI